MPKPSARKSRSGRPDIGAESRALTEAQRNGVAATLDAWVAIADAHKALASRTAAARDRVARLRADAPGYAVAAQAAEDAVALRDVLVTVVHRARSDVTRRIHNEWTRWWIGERRHLLAKWLRVYKDRKYPTRTLAMCDELVGLLRTDSPGLEWSAPDIDVPALLARLDEDAVGTVLGTQGPVKAADLLLATQFGTSDRRLRTSHRKFVQTRVRRPRRLPR